jgi:hypothetical protein
MQSSPLSPLLLLIVTAVAFPACDSDDGSDGFDTSDGLISTPIDAGLDTADTEDIDEDASHEDIDVAEEGGGIDVPCDNEGEACNDGLPCTTGDLCTDGNCAGAPVYTDGLDCTLNCSVLNGGPIEVLVVLTGCAIDGACWTEHTLNPANPCQVCEPTRSDSSWSALADGTLCMDNDPCTVKTSCQSGICAGTSLFEDGDPCTANCAVGPDGEALSIQDTYPDGTACEDGNACTTDDICLFGACLGSDLSCDDFNLCTLDLCEEGVCQHTASNDALACDDGDECTLDDVCVVGFCLGSPLDCSADDACLDGWCTSLGCVFTEKYEDGNPCTDNCEVDEQGIAVATSNVLGDGSACVDVLTCSESPTCLSGVCTATDEPCDDGDLSTDDSCVDGVCVNTPNE